MTPESELRKTKRLMKRLAAALETAAGQYGAPTDEQRNEWMKLVLVAAATERDPRA